MTLNLLRKDLFIVVCYRREDNNGGLVVSWNDLLSGENKIIELPEQQQDKSPLLRHAIESFEHGLEHYLEGSDKGRKFAFIHIDHAIELILKEKLRRLGKTFIKRKGEESLSLGETLNSLEKKNVKIPERPTIEMLHQSRNSIQHSGWTPDQGTTEFHIKNAYLFFSKFLREELDMAIEKILPTRFSTLVEVPKVEELRKGKYKIIEKRAKEELERMVEVLNSSKNERARLYAAKSLQILCRKPISARTKGVLHVFEKITKEKNDEIKIELLRAMRNCFWHAGDDKTKRKVAENCIKVLRKLIRITNWKDRVYPEAMQVALVMGDVKNNLDRLICLLELSDDDWKKAAPIITNNLYEIFKRDNARLLLKKLEESVESKNESVSTHAFEVLEVIKNIHYRGWVDGLEY